MGLQWATRAKAMDDPTKSRVVGKIDWVAPPHGHARISSRRLRDLRLQQAGSGHAVPHHRDVGQPGEHARRGVAADAAAPVAAGRSGAEGRPTASIRRRWRRCETGAAVPGAAGVLRGRRVHHPPHPAGRHRRDGGEAGAGRGGDGDRRTSSRVTAITSDVAAPPSRRLLRTRRKLVAVPGAERARARRGHAVSARLRDLPEPVQLRSRQRRARLHRPRQLRRAAGGRTVLGHARTARC